jgi:hypothetical protein
MITIGEKIKAMNFKLLFISISLLIFSNSISGQPFSETRTYKRSVPATREMTLEVNNKYGTIHITSWNKDSVSVRAEIEAFASNPAKLRKMFEGVNIDFGEANNLFMANTDFTQGINMILQSFKGMTNKLIPYDSRLQINYFVSLPEYINLKIDNRYGDIYMENNTSNISIKLSNGSFKANSLNRASDLTLIFCDATINKIDDGNLDASFSEVVIGESRNLTINSISSRFDLRQANKIRAESRRDKFFIGTIESIQGNSYFTDFKIEKLKNEINLETKYGSINVDLVERSFELISINSGYSDISLSFDPSVSYNLDIRHINSFLTAPDKNSKLEKKAINEDKKEYITYGTVGRNPGNSKVKIDATRGNIYIR